MDAKSDSYTLSGRSAALPYPKHGRRRMPAPMRSPCTYLNIVYASSNGCDQRNGSKVSKKNKYHSDSRSKSTEQFILAGKARTNDVVLGL